MVRYLTEDDVKSLVTLPEAIELMAAAFRDRANGDAVDTPRRRTRHPQGHLQVLQAAATKIDAVGFKYYFAGRDARTTLVHLHQLSTGVFEAMIEADWLGITRTAATTALATRLLARADARIVACIGTGRHAVHPARRRRGGAADQRGAGVRPRSRAPRGVPAPRCRKASSASTCVRPRAPPTHYAAPTS